MGFIFLGVCMMRKLSWLFLMVLYLSGCAPPSEEKASDTEEENSAVVEQVEVKKEVNTTSQSSVPVIKDANLGVDPVTIEIPSIDVKTEIEDVGRLENGQMGVPENVDNTGWFEPGTKPGNRGSAVIAGHVDDKTGPSVFFKLEDMENGDEIIVTGENEKRLVFKVVGKEVFPRNDAPVSEIFGYTSRRMLNLITCTGDFDNSAGTHNDRLVVYTELVE